MTLTALLQLCDSLFPIGGFAHSDGLEAAVVDGRVAAGPHLEAWMDAVLDQSLGRVDGPGVLLAWRAAVEHRVDDLVSLDEELHALRPSFTARAASRAMGARLLGTWRQIHPEHALASQVGDRLALPVAFGVVAAAAGVESRHAVESFAYTRLAATVSAAMRLMSIGQLEAHRLLSRTLARVPATVDAIEARVLCGGRPGGFMPALDVAAMAQRHVRSRLFLS
jgi:urease accessory protein